jgi:hypothetical protein
MIKASINFRLSGFRTLLTINTVDHQRDRTPNYEDLRETI